MSHAPSSWHGKSLDKLRSWEANSPRKQNLAYAGCFTLAFAIVALASLSAWFLFGKELIWQADGLRQYLPYFIYEGEWLRNLFGGLVSGQGWNPELWSFSMGYGTDVLATLDVFWNPLNLLSAFASPENAEYMFQFVVVLRLYLAGLAFSWYARYRGNGHFATLCGALLYSLCGTALIATIWPGGTDGLILFPLLLVGAEKVLDGKRPTTFITAVALFFIVTYYLAYSAYILLIPYCIARLLLKARSNRQKATARAFFAILAKFVLFSAVGILISAVALVPGVMTLLGTERATSALAEVPLLYSAEFYQTVIAGWLGTSQVGSDCSIGFGVMAFLCCVMLFLQRGRELPLKITFCLLTACMLLPFFGSMFNGFNYATNRWIWAYALCIAYIVVRTAPCFLQMTHRQKVALASAAFLYCVVILAIPSARNKPMLAAIILLALSTAALCLASRRSKRATRVTTLSLLCVSLVTVGYTFAYPFNGGWATYAIGQGEGWKLLTSASVNSVATQVEDDSWWRYDAAPAAGNGTNGAWSRPENDSVVLGLQGIDFYYSFYNNDIDAYHTQLGIAGDQVNFRYYNLGGRAMLETLNNVKYYATPQNETDTPAYGYDNPDKLAAQGTVCGGGVAVYEGEYTLPLGYTYSKVISQSTYDSLTPIQRQEALLQGMVVKDQEANDKGLSASDLSLTSSSVDYRITGSENLTINDDGAFTAEQAGATLTLQVSGQENSETYLYLTGLSCDPQQYADPQTANPIVYSLYAKADKGSENRVITNYLPTNHMYGGKTDWALNLGYSDEAQSSITITFSPAGTYSFDDMQVVCQPMDSMASQIDDLKADVLQGTQVETNSISGTIELSQAKYLYFSIPYSSGWTAWVDGQPVAIEKANVAFMAIPLDAGTHAIELRFTTPWLTEGAMASALGLVAWVGIMLYYRKKEPARAANGSRALPEE